MYSTEMQHNIISWVYEIWQSETANSDQIRNDFIKCGLTVSTDGTQEHLVDWKIAENDFIRIDKLKNNNNNAELHSTSEKCELNNSALNSTKVENLDNIINESTVKINELVKNNGGEIGKKLLEITPNIEIPNDILNELLQ